MTEVTYSKGPRYIDGINIDADVDASFPVEDEVNVTDPVTGMISAELRPELCRYLILLLA